MIALQVARLIANFVLSLEFADEETVDPQVIMKVFETLEEDCKALDKGSLRELVDAFATISSEYQEQYQQLVRNLPHDFFLEKAATPDDTVRLELR